MERIFLNEKTPLVHAVTEWLRSQCRVTPSGVQSLSHVLVIVPTRQAGRRLRLALAQLSGNGCLPPLIRLPMQMIVPAREPALPVATPAETLGLLSRFLTALDLKKYPCLFPAKGHPREQTFSWALGAARQLTDLWSILQENALLMRDVAAQIEAILSDEDLDVEVARWQDLAKLESLFFAELQEHGRTPPPLARQQAVDAPQFPSDIEHIVLPALADAQPALYPVLAKLSACVKLSVLIHANASDDAKFDSWGRPEPKRWIGDYAPTLPLSDNQIVLASNSAEQARLVAETMAAVPADAALPSLGLADDDLFSELQSTFLTRNIPLHNPADYPLAPSSLGRLIQQLERLCREPRFTVLAAFLREADVMHWAESRLARENQPYATVLSALDELQNTHLPQTLEAARIFCAQALDNPAQTQTGSGDEDSLRWRLLLSVLTDVSDLLNPRGRPHLAHLTKMLQNLFENRVLSENTPGDRELAAAAAATLAVFETLATNILADTLNDGEQSLLLETLLATASYQLEPDNADALLTEGWLELPWSPARELVITGFNDGAVPDTIVGHAFLPDRLRQGLGLTSNERRTARDTYLLQALLASRPPQAVRIYLERVSSRHDVRKPSSLLFLCDDVTLAARAKILFRDAERTATGHRRSLPDAWRLNLPIPAEPPQRFSATSFKGYLECPFTFYLQHVLKMEACDDRAAELDAMAFGTLCHNALEAFGRAECKDSADAEEISEFLSAEIQRSSRLKFGDHIPAVLQLQVSAACRRMRFFAAAQARLRDEGWQIVDVERPLKMTENGMAIRGRADRIDYHPGTGAWRIIDYKTWDKLGEKDGRSKFISSKKSDVEAAIERGFPSFGFEDKTHVWTDLQLPLYMLMAQAGAVIPAEVKTECGYFVLGETETETVCKTWDFVPLRDSAIAAMRHVIACVTAGIYWPPSSKDIWERDFGSLFLDSPVQSIDATWIDDQTARLNLRRGTCAS